MFGIFKKSLQTKKKLEPIEYSDWFDEAIGRYLSRHKRPERLEIFDAISRAIGEEHVDPARLLFFEEPVLAMQSLVSCVIHTNTAIQIDDFDAIKGWFEKNGYDPRFKQRITRDLEYIKKNLIRPIEET